MVAQHQDKYQYTLADHIRNIFSEENLNPKI